MFQMNLTYPLADRHPLPTGLKDVPGCLSASPHSTHTGATILAFALSHGDRLQVRLLQAICLVRACRFVTSMVDTASLPPSSRRDRQARRCRRCRQK